MGANIGGGGGKKGGGGAGTGEPIKIAEWCQCPIWCYMTPIYTQTSLTF